MNNVYVKYRGHLASLTGTIEESFDAACVQDLLKLIRNQYSREAEKTARAMLITVNGESIHLLRRYKTVLAAGDIVSFFPVCDGG